MSYLAVATVLVAVVLLGSRLGTLLVGAGARPGRRAVEGPLDRLVLFFVAGLVVLHVVLLGLSLLGVRWSLVSLGSTVAVYAVGTWPLGRTPVVHGELAALRRELGWGDAVAALAVAVFAGFAVRHWIVFPDLVYHWGIKAKRFLLVRGVDFELLSDPAYWFLHRDYPPLLPELLAVTGMARGHFTERGVMVWSVVFLLALVLAARRLLSAHRVRRFAQQAATAIVALVAAGFGIGFYLAGSADWLLALALLIAAVPLTTERSGVRDDWQVALAASLALASKVEGAALAVFLVITHLLRSRSRGGFELLMTLGRTAMPPLAIGVLWLVSVVRFGLAESYYAGGLAWERLPTALAAMGEGLLVIEWTGIPLAAVVLLVATTVRRRTQALAAVCWCQLLFFVVAYALAPVDTGALVASSFARLLFQLVPTILVVGVVAPVGTRRE